MKVLIVGAGQLGYHTAEKLSRESNDVIVIERDPEKARHILEHLDVQVLTGSGSSPEVLRKAGVESADFLVAVTDSDEVNMVACLLAAAQAKTPRKIARIRNPELLEHSRIFGQDFLNVDYAVNPDGGVVKEVLALLRIPGSTNVASFCRDQVSVVGFRIPPDSPLIGPTLGELWKSGTSKERLLLAAIVREHRTIVPHGSETVRAGDIVFVVHPTHRLDQVYPMLGLTSRSVRMVMVSGATRIGIDLARKLQEDPKVSVKLIDPNRARCEALVETLDRTLILCADPHSEEVLKEEGIESCDAFIACSEDDDTNVLTSLLARGLGAQRAITLVNQVRYVSLVQALGDHVALCPKMVAVSQIVQFVRRGKVVSLATFGSDEAEAMEVVALERSGLVNKPLFELALPKGVIVGAIYSQDHLVIPNGSTVIAPGDRIVFFLETSSRPGLEKLLTRSEQD